MTAARMRSLLDRVRVVESVEDRERLVQTLASEGGAQILSFLNQHGFNLAYSDREVCEALVTSDVLLRDGVGLEVAMRVLNRPAGVNCNGTDLIPEILRTHRGRSAAVFGTREPWLSAAVSVVADWGVDVVVSRDGFRTDDDYISEVREHRPEIVLLGMGMPRQEMLSVKIGRAITHRCLIVNGGAILDFLGGRYPRAPLSMRRLRLEWLFRLGHEPRRLFGRYVLGGTTFALRVFRIRQGTAQRG